MPFSVNVQVATTAAGASVQVTPASAQRTSSDEAVSFGLDDNGLKALWNKKKNAWPDDVRLGDPCRANDNWFAQYGWPETKTNYSVVSASVLSVDMSDAAAASTKLINTTQQTATFQPTLSTSTTNTVGSSTTTTNSVGVSQTINYGISFLGTGGGGSTTLNYSYAWGNEQNQSQANDFSLTAAAAISVPPNATIVADLMLQKGKMVVQIVYQLSLSGFSEANFGHRVDDHYIWANDINDLLSQAGKPTTIEVTETITIGFYANASITFSDGSGNTLQAPISSGYNPKSAM